MLVFDASVIVKLLVREPDSDLALQAAERDGMRIAPDWIRIESASALGKKVRFADLTANGLRTALEKLEPLIDEMIDTMSLLDRAVGLSIELDHSLFDCLYLALAVERGCPVLTADGKFAAKAIAAGYEANVERLR